MTVYNAATGKTEFLNAREVAPLAAYETMYDGDGSVSATGDV